MAGIIDIRYNPSTRKWTAKPRFAWSKETYQNGAPVAEGWTAESAAREIALLLPEDLGVQLSRQIPHRIYRSPEYEWMDDKCIEVDGHCPVRGEWLNRRVIYMRKNNIRR